ncbi:YbhB/YbcL family Raf kinase inhibitor-like protein [Apilactobacillus ozensis]|uniref:YbhB/YbcL family Raf kinase inhibitor-like protein n=1 Tax=Apilactobacillus ozensis TaxID=866801 RepID=UPI00200B437A|nr:YbhB/YbcL family Raf kinase inhibitor-like protein [Apilactobacillus ozensis]MCK8607263.1 YbhB/YbcL family Raf kinase inhibitor-like protein [Apilactobacillus ozensis]
MKINVPLMDNGYLDDKYTKHTTAENIVNGLPAVSFPIDIADVPNNAKTLAITLTDLDAIPVCGFEWIHWIAANVPADCTHVPENAGKENPLGWNRGYNSLAGRLLDRKDDPLSLGFVGPAPPRDIHDYTLTVYALDEKLPLADGFWYNELLHTIKGHVLDKATLELPVKS